MPRTAILLSGGVDSSVALTELVTAGDHDLTAFYLKIWLEDELAFLGRCPWQDDLDVVRRVCATFGVPLEVVSLQREYQRAVIGYVLAELEAGRTPSPDVICNRAIKFAAFVDRIDPSFDLVASGHYARTARSAGLVRLLRGVDPVKDQSYFLSQLSQRQLARCLFPVGSLEKAEVRRRARARGLVNADRPDSQGICFLGRVPYDDFLGCQLGERPGDIRDADSGHVLGRHRGHWFHTIGQRRGLGLADGPWYVVAKDSVGNLLWVAHRDRLARHARRELLIDTPHWIAAPPARRRLAVRIRHGERLLPCSVELDADGGAEVILDEPDPGVAPGQFAVLYDGQECLGGGAIAGRSR